MPISTVFNEGKACDAVIRQIEARHDALRANVRSPEKERHTAPVELVCTISEKLYAIEHTGIEPFDGHMRLQAEAPKQLEPIRLEIEKTLTPDECVQLSLPLKAFEGMKGRELKTVQDSITAWVKHTAPALPYAPYGRLETAANARNVSIPGVPFNVSLYRWRAEFGGPRFQVSHIHNGNLEDDRFERILRAYNKKIPKLEKWRRESGARSVLVLEDNDIQLSNPEVIAKALMKIEEGRTEKPDEIYLVTTCIDDPWWVWAMRIDNVGYYELRQHEDTTTEISPPKLTDLMSA
jgi:hypothetical protein